MGFFDDNGWVRNGLATQIANADNDYFNNQARYDQLVHDIRGMSVDPAQWMQQNVGYPQMSQLAEQLSQFNPNSIMANSGQFMTPGMQQSLEQMLTGGMAGYTQGQGMNQNVGGLGQQTQAPLWQTANQGFQGGGWTPQYQQAFDMLGGMMNPATNPTLATQMGAGQGLIQSGGMDPFTQAMQQFAQQGVAGGGQTPQSQTLGNVGAQILGNNPLMSGAQAASMAANQAGTDTRNAAEAMMAKAVSRGAAPGSVVASGLGNEVMADFADQMSQNQSKAIMDALMGQQQLGLQQWNQAAGMLGESGQLQNQNLNTYGQMGLGAGAQANDRMGLGAQLLGNTNQLQLGGVNAMGNLMGNQNQYALGLGNLASQTGMNQVNASNQQFDNNLNNSAFLQGLYNQGFQNDLAAGQLGVQRGNSLIQGQLGGQQNQQGFINGMNNMYNNQVTNPMMQFLQFPQNAALTALGARVGGVPVGQGGANQGLLSKIGQVGGMVGGLAGMFI